MLYYGLCEICCTWWSYQTMWTPPSTPREVSGSTKFTLDMAVIVFICPHTHTATEKIARWIKELISPSNRSCLAFYSLECEAGDAALNWFKYLIVLIWIHGVQLKGKAQNLSVEPLPSESSEAHLFAIATALTSALSCPVLWNLWKEEAPGHVDPPVEEIV